MVLYAGVHSSGYHAPMYGMARTRPLLGLACQPLWQVVHTAPAVGAGVTTLQSHLQSLSIVTCSTGLPHRFAAYRLSFPLQTRVCRTHAWGWCFYSTTWRVRVSLTGTLSCQSPETLPLIPRSYRFRANGSHTKRAADKSGDGSSFGESALNGFFVLRVFPVKVPLLPLTPAVRLVPCAIGD